MKIFLCLAALAAGLLIGATITGMMIEVRAVWGYILLVAFVCGMATMACMKAIVEVWRVGA